MANLILPLATREIENNIPYFIVSKIPFSSYIAYLSSDSLYIRETANYDHNIIFQIIRGKESLDKYGPNQWIQYIDRNNICFGTKNGLFIVFNFHTKKAYSKHFHLFFASYFHCHHYFAFITPDKDLHFVKLNINQNQNNSKAQNIDVIELPDNDDQITLMPIKYNFDFSRTTITTSTFYHRLSKPKLATIINTKPCFITISPTMISSYKQLSPEYLEIENTAMISINTTHGFTAVAQQDGKVVAFVDDDQSIFIHQFEHDEVVFMRWTKDDANLLIVSAKGTVVMFELPTYTVYTIAVPILQSNSNISKIVSIDYDDDYSKSFYVITRTDSETSALIAIEVASLLKEYAFTSSSVYDLQTKKSYRQQIFPLKFLESATLNCKLRNSKESQEIVMFEESNEILNSVFVASIRSLQKGDKVFTFSDDDEIQGMKFLNGYLFVFVFSKKNEETRFTVFDENLNPMKLSVEKINHLYMNGQAPPTAQVDNGIHFISFPHTVHSISSNFIDSLVVSCHSMYSIIKFTSHIIQYNGIDLTLGLDREDDDDENLPRNRKNQSTVKFSIDNSEKALIELTIKTFSVRLQLKNVVITGDQGIFLHFLNGTGQLLGSNFHVNEIGYTFYEPFSNVLFIQKKHSYIILIHKYQIEFKGVACFSDMIETYSLRKIDQFGCICYNGIIYFPFLLLNNIDDSNQYLLPRFEKMAPSKERFDTILALSVSVSLSKDKDMINSMENIFPIIFSITDINRIAFIFNKVFSSLEDLQSENNDITHKLRHLINFDIKWSDFFDLLLRNNQNCVLTYLNPIKFERFLDVINLSVWLKTEDKTAFLKDLLTSGQLLRTFMLCNAIKIDFTKLVKEIYNANSIDFKEMIEIVEKDRADFNLHDDNGMLKFMGTRFCHSKLLELALAVFVVIEETIKVDLIIKSNPELIDIIKKYEEDCPNSKYAKILSSVQSNNS